MKCLTELLLILERKNSELSVFLTLYHSGLESVLLTELLLKNEVLSFASLAAKMENFDFDVKVRVKGFTLRVSKDGTFKDKTSGNNRLTSDMKALLERV